ncbi:MAG: isochorismatase family cysteine hydrolase [Bacteroidota bacterium]
MKKALILIECQNEWLSPKGKLHSLIEDKEMVDLSAVNIEKVLRHARNVEMPIAHVGLRFQKGYPELANGKSGLHKAIPIVGTFPLNEFGSQFYEPLQPIENEFIVTGRTGASGFAGSNLDVWLRNNKIDDLYIVGYATHVCVESTLREAHDKGYNPILVSDASAAFNRMQQDYVLQHIVHHFGESITTNEFLNVQL